MKKPLTIISLGLFTAAHAVADTAKPQPAHMLSPEETHQGVEAGRLCSDTKGAGYSRGAVIKQGDKIYRCMANYGEQLTPNKKLVWVEVKMENGKMVTAD